MEKLALHGRIDCSKCFGDNAVEFDKTQTSGNGWRITANPLAWGNQAPMVVVLGFSKGPTQAGAMASTPHDDIAYRGSRAKVAKILAHVGVLTIATDQAPADVVSTVIADRNGMFHFGSLIRCTVERYDENTEGWKSSGGGMLDRFVATTFGQKVARNCTERFLINLPPSTKLIMFGLGSKLSYVKSAFELYQAARGGTWRWINDIAYTDEKIVVVHVEHFASQGSLLPKWLGEQDHPRQVYGLQAKEAVAATLSGRHGLVPEASIPTHPPKPAVFKPPVKQEVQAKHQASKTIVADEDSAIVEVILRAISDAKYKLKNQNKKLAEFHVPNGQTIYVVKKNANMNNIKVMVHPGLSREHLCRLAGVEVVSPEHRFHSNMGQFPKKLNKGKTETTYGWQVTLGTISGLETFLNAFQKLNDACGHES